MAKKEAMHRVFGFMGKCAEKTEKGRDALNACRSIVREVNGAHAENESWFRGGQAEKDERLTVTE